MKQIILVISLMLSLASCKSSQQFTRPDGEARISEHHRVAVLPFQVRFSEDYKEGMRSTSVPWVEQERIAGIDLQKEAFLTLQKKVTKKKWNITVQDYLTTNRRLEESGISFSRLMAMDKAKVADILGVDAVIYGSSDVEYNFRRGFTGFNGLLTAVHLYDGELNDVIWTNKGKEYLRSGFDSPQDLGRRSVSGLVESLPYRYTK